MDDSTTILQGQSPAKINLFLHITGRLPDGYHTLESVFWPVDITDNIAVTVGTHKQGPLVSPKHHEASFPIQRSGDLLHIPEDQDLTVRAAKKYLLRGNLPSNACTHIHVEKTIPEQAGLGGGSSNAATVLMLLQKHFMALTPEALFQVAAELGADVPFFLLGGPAFVEGVGHEITPLPLPNAAVSSMPCCAIVYKPPINCATKAVFQAAELTRSSESVRMSVFGFDPKSFRSVVKHGFSFTRLGWRCFWNQIEGCCNALQVVVAAQHPDWLVHYNSFAEMCQNKNNRHGIEHSQVALLRMTGSGSAIFALFYDNESAKAVYENVLNHPVLRQGQLFSCNLLV